MAIPKFQWRQFLSNDLSKTAFLRAEIDGEYSLLCIGDGQDMVVLADSWNVDSAKTAIVELDKLEAIINAFKDNLQQHIGTMSGAPVKEGE